MWQQWFEQLIQGDHGALARAISFVENEQEGYQQLMEQLPHNHTSKIIGITGPPGAGKSTLVDGLIKIMTDAKKRIGVICVDPSSPFNLGAVLGDRIRMSSWYIHPHVFIRSLATRGSMGGLHPKIIEVTELMKAAGFDYIIVETVGVGQSEIEIAGLADTTIVTLVPEGGDEIQTMKAGLMEIADIFVVNKSDRPGADAFISNLRLMLAPAFHSHTRDIPIVKTVASSGKGMSELFDKLKEHSDAQVKNEKRSWLLTERIYHLVQEHRMKDFNRKKIKTQIDSIPESEFNLYRFVRNILTASP